MERLNRGLVAVMTGTNRVFLSWRMLGNESDEVMYNVYRNNTKITSSPIQGTNYTDNNGTTTSQYSIRPVLNGVELQSSETVLPWAQQYLQIPVMQPAGGTSPDGVAYSYEANDASIGDVDGDGVYEIFLKWQPTNAKDNSQSGYTGNTIIDCYRINGTRLWRIDLGINIRSGAHYTQFMVYDFDGDGRAEMMCKTADGTKDGMGNFIGNAAADHRNASGYILTGPEYLTVFEGLTGRALATTNYLPGRGTVSAWGDNYGNRVDRFVAGVAYLDGQRPSAIFNRGYYTRVACAAWDWRNGQLSNRWVFDTGNNNTHPFYAQGNHSLSIADVDEDGRDEIIIGSAIIDDNGTGYYSTRFGHGDAGHVSDLDPTLPGIEIFNIQEPVGDAGAYMYSGRERRVLWQKPSAATATEGPGRGVSADISAAYFGAESWVAGGGISGVFDTKGNLTNLANPPSCNFLAWWDGDLLRELLNGTVIDKFGTGRLLTAHNIVPVSSNNGTKSTPCLSGDIIGDWREEVIWRASDNQSLFLFTTTIPSTYRFRTLLHNPQYRVALAWQNSGYNQPPHVNFYLGDGMGTPVWPSINIINPPALDLNIFSFNTNCHHNAVHIYWKSDENRTNGYYLLERANVSSKKFLSDAQWEPITTLHFSSGVCDNGICQYNYVDNHLDEGKYYYRLSVQTEDKTKKITYISDTPCTEEVFQNFSLYPNPSLEGESVILNLKTNNYSELLPFEIFIRNQQGVLIERYYYEQLEENEELKITLQNIPAGIYYVQCLTHNKTLTFNWLVIK